MRAQLAGHLGEVLQRVVLELLQYLQVERVDDVLRPLRLVYLVDHHLIELVLAVD